MLSRFTRIGTRSLSNSFNQDINLNSQFKRNIYNALNTNHRQVNLNYPQSSINRHIYNSSYRSSTKDYKYLLENLQQNVLTVYFNDEQLKHVPKYIKFPVFLGTVAGFLFGVGVIFTAGLKDDIIKALILSPFILPMFTIFGSFLGAIWFVSVPLLLIELCKFFLSRSMF